MMTTTQCPTADQLRAYTLGRLPEGEYDEVYEHLRGCQSCQADLETVDDADDSLIQELRSEDPSLSVFDEPDCQLAMAKALGALAGSVSEPTQDQGAAEIQSLPDQIGEYEIVRPIGRGGMGQVFLARQTKLGRRVAVKILAGHRLADQRMKDRFDAEMQAIGRLSHPNIVTAYDAREVDATAVLITEFIDGFDLNALIKRTGPLSVPNACEVIRKIAAALQYIGDQGFVHRDVKPSNIMISRSGEVKLLDLGLARYESGNEVDLSGPGLNGPVVNGAALTGTGQAIGTPDYVSPEQVTDGRKVDGRSDVYSLGCTLFTLLTGNAPFSDADHTTAFSKMTAHVSQTPARLCDRMNDCPIELSRLVERMLVKDPKKRTQTSSEVAAKMATWAVGHDLAELVDQAFDRSEQTRALPASTLAPSPRWYRRKVPMTVAIASALLGGILGMMMGLFIKVTYRDGTVVQFPISGAKVEVVQGDQEPKQSSKSHDAEDLGVDSYGLDLYSAEVRTGEARWDEAHKADPATPPAGRSPSPSPGQFESAMRGPAPMRGRTQADHFSRVNGVWKLVGYEIADDVLPREMLLAIDFDEFYAVTSDRNPLPEISVGSITRMQSQWNQVSLATVDRVTGNEIAVTCHFGDSGEATFEFDPFRMPDVMPFQGNRKNTGRPQVNYRMEKIATFPITAEDRSKHRQSGNPSLLEVIEELRSVGAEKYLESREMASKTQAIVESTNHLKQLALAFHNFHAAYQKFPGSVNTLEGSRSTGGKSVEPFSWRVALLPFLGQNELYERYRFDEPWDSENNLKLGDEMPEVFRSPRQIEKTPQGYTNYLGYATENSALWKEGGVSMREFRDGTSNTLLLIESKDAVPWTKPEDLHGDAKFFDPVIYAMADGSVRQTENLSKEMLDKLISLDDRERSSR